MKQKMVRVGVLLAIFVLVSWGLPPVGIAQTPVTCGGPGTPLQSAIDAAGVGDTLSVSGTCTENVVIREEKAGLTLDGQGTATINGPDTTIASAGLPPPSARLFKWSLRSGRSPPPHGWRAKGRLSLSFVLCK